MYQDIINNLRAEAIRLNQAADLLENKTPLVGLIEKTALEIGETVAARVDAMMPFFPATITKLEDDGTITVRDNQSGKIYDHLPAVFIRKESRRS